ncbi:MAG: histidine kinase dimerization/phosphoacceptor domain -containing protein [Flavobacteriales bacterium]
MKKRRRFERFLVVAIIVLLVSTFGFILSRWMKMEKRAVATADLGLERAQQLYRVRLDALFHELGEDLREECAAVQEMDSTTSTDLLKRWRPLMNSHWPILTVRLADERGSETALIRKGMDYQLYLTAEGSNGGSVIQGQVTNEARMGRIDSVWISDLDYDPRDQPWFSKALEDARNEPAWNMYFPTGSEHPIMQLSMLIRGRNDSELYRIMAFEVDLSKSEALVTQATSLRRYGAMILSNDGRRIPTPDSAQVDPVLHEIEEQAGRTWTTDQIQWPRTFSHDGRDFRALITPYKLNGQTICTGEVIDLSSMRMWMAPERNTLIGMLIALSGLTFLLGWVRVRRGVEISLIRKQEKRTRTQEKRLAKALGERDVLNREVHHRVKNNLQVVSSLLNLQSARLEEGEVKEEFMRGKQRIDTIALVHHKLYELQDLRNVQLQLFFTNLITSLAEMHKPESNAVSYEVSTFGLKADQDTAIELGIIACELVSNTYRHAFPYATGGHVDIQITNVEGDLYRLVVKDNGRGLSEDQRQGPGKLGLEIVEAMADQLDGSFHVRTNGGVTFEVLFRMQYKPSDPDEAED